LVTTVLSVKGLTTSNRKKARSPRVQKKKELGSARTQNDDELKTMLKKRVRKELG